MTKTITTCLLVSTLALFTACGPEVSDVNYGTLPVFSEAGHVNVVIEIPAGTNKKLEYDYETNTFPADIENGEERVIKSLSYPGNYGFVPSTLMDLEQGGDGDALDVLVICPKLPTGTVVEVIPIALIELKDGGELDTKIIAIPVDKSLRVIDVQTYKQLNDDFGYVKRLIKIWFLNYKGKSIMKFDGWRDETEAMATINKWTITQ
jgi:inorganic pyrophosphatase